MLSTLRNILNRLSHNGIRPDTEESQVTRIILLNRILLITIALLTALSIKGLFEWGWTEVFLYGVTLLTLFIFLLVRWSHFKTAIGLFHGIYPLLLCLIGIGFGSELGVEYCLFALLCSVLILNEGKNSKLLFLCWFALLYVSMNVGFRYVEAPFAYRIDYTDRIVLFMISAIILTLFVMTFLRENRKYYKELQKVTGRLKDKNEELNVANRDLEQFAAITSHDLKTPLRSIASFAGLIKRDLDRGSTENTGEYLEFVTSAAKQMNFLISDILEYSKLGKGKVEKVNLSLSDIIMSIIRRMDDIIKKENVQVIMTDLPEIQANETQIQLLFQNLLENGIKYNRSEKKVIQIHAQSKPEYHIITIRDNGIGIAEHYHDQIFGMFKRLHAGDKFQGTGIGLAICQRIIDNHSGSISLDSEPGKGSTFYIRLPRLQLGKKEAAPEKIRNGIFS